MRKIVLTLACCLASVIAPLSAPLSAAENDNGYRPELGDLMGAIQMRHAKLGLAGRQHNWPLAAYELDELKEGFESVSEFHAEFNDKPLARMIEANLQGPLQHLEGAIDGHDQTAFARYYRALTRACNNCHRGAGYPFIVIQPPTTALYTNQNFHPQR